MILFRYLAFFGNLALLTISNFKNKGFLKLRIARFGLFIFYTWRTVGVNFIKVYTSSFYKWRSQNCKKLQDLTVSFALLGSAHIKAAHKMLLKLTPDLNKWVRTTCACADRAPLRKIDAKKTPTQQQQRNSNNNSNNNNTATYFPPSF